MFDVRYAQGSGFVLCVNGLPATGQTHVFPWDAWLELAGMDQEAYAQLAYDLYVAVPMN